MCCLSVFDLSDKNVLAPSPTPFFLPAISHRVVRNLGKREARRHRKRRPHPIPVRAFSLKEASNGKDIT